MCNADGEEWRRPALKNLLLAHVCSNMSPRDVEWARQFPRTGNTRMVILFNSSFGIQGGVALAQARFNGPHPSGFVKR